MHDLELEGGNEAGLKIYAGAAAFYAQLLTAGYIDEATEFAEWFLETFDLDLET